MWAAGYPGRSLFVFVNLVGIYAIFYGVTELFAAFDLRGLDQRMNRPGMPSLRRRGAPFFCGVRQQVSPTRGPPLSNLAPGRHHGPDAGRPAGCGDWCCTSWSARLEPACNAGQPPRRAPFIP
jgi:hypothetical protein